MEGENVGVAVVERLTLGVGVILAALEEDALADLEAERLTEGEMEGEGVAEEDGSGMVMSVLESHWQQVDGVHDPQL